MLTLSLPTGASAEADGAVTLDDAAFGARFISYRNEDRFLEQIEELEAGHIIWPGGTLAETRADRYGFEHDGLYNPDTGKPDLTEMMAIANAEDAALTVIVPTLRYEGRAEDLANDLQNFMASLLSGAYGPLPKELTLEIGSEYYAHFDGPDAASDYAELADVAVTEIAMALNDTSVNMVGADVSIGVQMGRTAEDDNDIRDGLSDFALSNTDLAIHHRFAFLPDGIDARVADVADWLAAWKDDVSDAGGEEVNLSVSAWNVATQTRQDVLADFLAENPGLTADDVDLDGRTTDAFERYWQDAMDDAAYGREHPGMIIETFHSYAEIGMASGGVYGVDSIHPGRLSLRGEDGQDHIFAGSEMLEMIYESVDGTRALESEAFDKNADVHPYAFENEDKLIVFMVAGDDNPGEVALDISGLGTTYQSVWADKLTAEVMPDWMDRFDVPDNPNVDETNEAWTYAVGATSGAGVIETEQGVTVDFSEAHQVIRLSFAKTDVGAREIREFSEGTELALDLPPVIDNPDPGNDVPDMDEEFDDGDGGGGGGAGAGIAGILPLLLFFL